MKYTLLILTIYITSLNCKAQTNCNSYPENSPCYKACKLIYGDSRGGKSDFQGAFESQQKLDSAIMLCPTFADAYYTKAIPYLKRGEFIAWKKIIDKAVEYNEFAYLGYRGGSRFMFIRDYEGAIEDIEKLKEKAKWDIGAIYNGEIHLEIILALSYRELGNLEKAVEILKAHNEMGFYGHLYLGTTLLQLQQYDEAQKELEKQIELNDYFADNYYYLAMINKAKGNLEACKKNLMLAHDYFLQDKAMRGIDSYMDYPDKVYLQQIERELLEIENEDVIDDYFTSLGK